MEYVMLSCLVTLQSLVISPGEFTGAGRTVAGHYVSGTPTKSGLLRVHVKSTDTNGHIAEKDFEFQIPVERSNSKSKPKPESRSAIYTQGQ